MPSRSRSLSSSPGRPRSGFLYHLEACCCGALTYFPLFFVYSLTTWAAWVGVTLGFAPYASGHLANKFTSALVAILYVLADASYTASVFTPPGSPLDPLPAAAYTSLPTTEPDATASPNAFASLTLNSKGKPRYCKRCVCAKPDRTHHCSTCERCVLRMDHHCPWLATCVGFHNHKAFLLFLIYICLFCWVTFLLSGEWVWRELFNVDNMEHSVMVVHIVLLSVLSGIIGLVMSCFAGWHLYLAASNQTTIECLEKTQYFKPLKDTMEEQFRRADQRETQHPGNGAPLFDQIKEIHANALPGITRPEEGESTTGTSTPQYDSPATQSLRRSYREMEEQRERDRYEQYLDELDSKKLPHAYNLGWRRNLALIFGSRKLLWALPVKTVLGDGWTWEVSEEFIAARQKVAQERLSRGPPQHHGYGRSGGAGAGRHYYEPPPMRPPRNNVELRRLSREDGDEYDTSSDEEPRQAAPTSNWNDVPAEFLRRSPNPARGVSRGRTKGD